MTRVGRTTTAIQPTSTGLTKVDSARDIVLVRSKIRNNSANTPKRGLNLYRLNSAKNTTTIRPVTQNRQQGIASPRAEHKAKLMALGIEETDEAKAQRLQRTPACLTCGKPGMQSGQHRNALETHRYLNALRALIAFFAWTAATSDHWNSFEWKRFLARIYSPKASFWDWSLRLRFEQSYCEYQIGVTLGNDAKLAAA